MDLEDENHIQKTSLELYSMVCKKNGHPQLAQKSSDMASLIKCNPLTKCAHNKNNENQ